MSARFALAVLLAWLMPWRAAARIRGQEESINWLVRTVAGMAAERDGRPRPSLRVIEGGRR